MADIFKERYAKDCEYCNSNPCLTDCPEFLIDNDTEEIKPISNLFKDYIIDNDILNNELTNQLGNHLMLIADAVLKAQKEWEQKSFMNRMSDVISNFQYYADFSESLKDAGAFDTVDDVIDYIKNPNTFDKLYNFWLELGYPSAGDEMFLLFKERVLEDKDLQ